MQRSATQGELLDAPDSWSASLACGPESTRHTALFLGYILPLDVLHLKSFFILFVFNLFFLFFFFIFPSSSQQPFSFSFCEQRASYANGFFLWGGNGVGSTPSHGSIQEGFHTWSCLVTSNAKLEFSSISLLALPASLGSLLLTAESPDGGLGGGAAQCKRCLASSTCHSPQHQPASLLPTHKYCKCMHTHAVSYK